MCVRHKGLSINLLSALSSIALVKMVKDLVLFKIRWSDSELQTVLDAF